MSWAALRRKITAASAMETARPADWCEDTTNPNTIQEKVNNLVLFCIILDGSYQAITLISVVLISYLRGSWLTVPDYFLSLYSLPQAEDTVVVVPYRSRHVRLVLKGPDHLCKSW